MELVKDKIVFVIDDECLNKNKNLIASLNENSVISFSFFITGHWKEYENNNFIFLKDIKIISSLLQEKFFYENNTIETEVCLLYNEDVDLKTKYWKSDSNFDLLNYSFLIFNYSVVNTFIEKWISKNEETPFNNIVKKNVVNFETFLFIYNQNKIKTNIKIETKNNRDLVNNDYLLNLFSSLGYFRNDEKYIAKNREELKDGLTFLIIFNDFSNDFYFFINMIKKIENDDVEFVFLFDSKNINFSFFKKLLDENIKFKFNNEKMGWFHTVINAISSNNVTKKWIKIVNHDDVIVWFNIKDFVNELKKCDENTIIKHSGAKVKNKKYFYKSLDFKKTESQLKNSFDEFDNQQIIYPTKIIKENNFNQLTRQEFNNDVLILNLINGLGYPLVFVYGKINLQFSKKRQAKKKNILEMSSIFELYLNYFTFSKNNSNFNITNLSLSYENHLSFIEKFTLFYDNDSEFSKIIYRETIENLDKLFKLNKENKKEIINSKNELYIGYLIDNNVNIKCLLTSIYSIFLNGKCNKIKILSYLVDEEKLFEINNFSKKLNLDIEVKKIDDINLNFYFDNQKGDIKHISQVAYLKIMFPKIFNNINILYLDIDIMVVGDLNKINFKHNKAITVVKNGYISPKYWFEIYGPDNIFNSKKETKKAFNSGVIFFSGKNKKKNIFINKYLESISNNNFSFLDQSHFNFVYKNHTNFLDLNYNWPHHSREKNIVKKHKGNPVIIHFASKNKPWTIRETFEYSFYENLWKYYNEKVNEISIESNVVESKKLDN